MRKYLMLIVLCLVLVGCSHNEPQKQADSEAVKTVEEYIRAAGDNKWDVVTSLLTGEALQEAEANQNRVKSTQKVLSIDAVTKTQTKTFAIVDAEVIKTNQFGNASYNDISGYEFRLKKTGNKWLIYNVQAAEIKKPKLHDGETGEMPAAAKEKLKDYIEMSITEKRNNDYKYLAGSALTNSLKNKGVEPKQQLNFKVVNISPIAVSDKYLVVEADYIVEMQEYKPANITAVADMVNLGGEWKIVRIDISHISSE